MNSFLQLRAKPFTSKLPSAYDSFTLPANYSEQVLEEMEILVSQSNFSLSDLERTPVYQRHKFINILRERREREQKEIDKANKK
jgi:hypothetical protein